MGLEEGGAEIIRPKFHRPSHAPSPEKAHQLNKERAASAGVEDFDQVARIQTENIGNAIEIARAVVEKSESDPAFDTKGAIDNQKGFLDKYTRNELAMLLNESVDPEKRGVLTEVYLYAIAKEFLDRFEDAA